MVISRLLLQPSLPLPHPGVEQEPAYNTGKMATVTTEHFNHTPALLDSQYTTDCSSPTSTTSTLTHTHSLHSPFPLTCCAAQGTPHCSSTDPTHHSASQSWSKGCWCTVDQIPWVGDLAHLSWGWGLMVGHQALLRGHQALLRGHQALLQGY